MSLVDFKYIDPEFLLDLRLKLLDLLLILKLPLSFPLLTLCLSVFAVPFKELTRQGKEPIG